MNACPHCGKPGISLWAKWNIKLHDPAICRFCGKTATVSFSKVCLLQVPFLLSMALFPFFAPFDTHPILGVCAALAPGWFFAGLILFLTKVPLIKVPRPTLPPTLPEVGPRWASRHDAEPPSTHIQRANDGLSKDESRMQQESERAGKETKVAEL
jgi:hypothetical protein